MWSVFLAPGVNRIQSTMKLNTIQTTCKHVFKNYQGDKYLPGEVVEENEIGQINFCFEKLNNTIEYVGIIYLLVFLTLGRGRALTPMISVY